MCVCAPTSMQTPNEEGRKGCQVPWGRTQESRRLLTQLPGTEHMSSARTVFVLNHRAIPPAP